MGMFISIAVFFLGTVMLFLALDLTITMREVNVKAIVTFIVAFVLMASGVAGVYITESKDNKDSAQERVEIFLDLQEHDE